MFDRVLSMLDHWKFEKLVVDKNIPKAKLRGTELKFSVAVL